MASELHAQSRQISQHTCEISGHLNPIPLMTMSLNLRNLLCTQELSALLACPRTGELSPPSAPLHS